jgi:hypothetical protein
MLSMSGASGAAIELPALVGGRELFGQPAQGFAKSRASRRS